MRGLDLVYTALNLPFVIWMMRSFIDEIPIELEEAARVDGDSQAERAVADRTAACSARARCHGVLCCHQHVQ